LDKAKLISRIAKMGQPMIQRNELINNTNTASNEYDQWDDKYNLNDQKTIRNPLLSHGSLSSNNVLQQQIEFQNNFLQQQMDPNYIQSQQISNSNIILITKITF
jgi:hypothetical protein